MSSRKPPVVQSSLPGAEPRPGAAAVSAALPIPPSLASAGLDLNTLRLPQDFSHIGGVKKVIVSVPVKKPGNQTYVKVRSGEEWRFAAAILQLQDDGENYLVLPSLYPELAQEARPKLIYTGITRDGNVFLWPVNLPGPDGRTDTWSQSAHAAAGLAVNSWVRLVANRAVGAYDVMEASNLAEEPAWPSLSLQEIINLAFKGRIIDSLDHPVLKRLRGEL